jgi:hypothetical protein
MKRNLKNAMFIGFVLMICALFASTAMAENAPGDVPPPTDFGLADGEVCFSWTAVGEATKYSLVIEVDHDGDEITEPYEFDFSSNDYGPGQVGDTVTMCIPRGEIAVDGELLSGPATVKVKGLNPGKDNGRQNNEFAYLPEEFILTGPEVE